MLKRVIAAALFLGVAQTSLAQPVANGAPEQQASVDPAGLAAAHRLMAAAHMDEALNAMVQAMIPQMVQSLGRAHGLSQSQMTMVSTIVREEMTADTPSLVEMMARLYAARLTVADLNAAADFYQSDAGKHFVAAQAQLSADGAAIGRAWGQQLLPRVLARIETAERTPGGFQP